MIINNFINDNNVVIMIYIIIIIINDNNVRPRMCYSPLFTCVKFLIKNECATTHVTLDIMNRP